LSVSLCVSCAAHAGFFAALDDGSNLVPIPDYWAPVRNCLEWGQALSSPEIIVLKM
jgi:hypothetical protein